MYVGSNNKAFFALDAASFAGSNVPLWNFSVSATISGTPALSWDESTVFFGDDNGTVRSATGLHLSRAELSDLPTHAPLLSPLLWSSSTPWIPARVLSRASYRCILGPRARPFTHRLRP